MAEGKEEHVERFSGRAAAYDQFRERYDPALVLPPLREWCGLSPEWTIADIGAGTGMLADVFLANGNRVIAVEPNEDMRGACVELHRSLLSLEVRDGTAVNTGLAESSVDMISIGRALHWFDLARCREEFRRVLKPGGWIAVVAFGRMESEKEENVQLELLLRTASSQDNTRAGYKAYEVFESYFQDGEFHFEQIDGVMQLDWDALRGLVLSISHAPLKSDERFPAFEVELRAFFRRFEHHGKIELATRYWINAARFA